MCEIEITSRIRQGCNGSGNLFLLITYYLIEKLYKSCNGYKDDIINIVALFFLMMVYFYLKTKKIQWRILGC